MRVGLIQAFDRETLKRKPIPPLGLAYLASYVGKYLGFTDINIHEDLDDLISGKPDLVGISAYTPFFGLAEEAARAVKAALSVPVIAGGIHITALPHTLPQVFDAAVLGEGEQTFLEVLELFQKTGRLPHEGLARIPGLVFWKGGQRVFTEPRPLIEPLDRIPFPKRDLLKWPRGTHYLFSSRGCPYSCAFCSPRLHWKKFRTFSAPYVVEEIKDLARRFDVEMVVFNDDLLIGNPGRMGELASLISGAGLPPIPFGGDVRANLVTPELCRLLAQMNFKVVSFGAESASERVLSRLKGGVTVLDNQRAVDLLFEQGIKIKVSFVILSPWEEYDDLMETIRFLFKNRGKLSQVSLLPLVPLPGTPVWQHAVEKGVVSEEMDWIKLNLDTFNPDEIVLHNFTRADMERFHREVFAMFSDAGMTDQYRALFGPEKE